MIAIGAIAIGGIVSAGAITGDAPPAAAAATCTLSSPFAVGGDLDFSGGTVSTPESTTRWVGWSQTWLGNWVNSGGFMNAGSTQTLTNRTNATSTPVPAAPRTLYNVTTSYVLVGAVRAANWSSATQAHWDPAVGAFVMPTGTTFRLYDSASRVGSTFTFGPAVAGSIVFSSIHPAVAPAGAFPPYPGITWSYSPGELVAQRLLADEIAPGANLTYTTGVQSGLETAPLTNVGPITLEMIAAQVCLPEPTIAGWTSPSADGLGTVAGTGTYPGDVIVVRDAFGATVGTAIVGADLQWSFELATALPRGEHQLTVTEVDAWEFEGSAVGAFPVGLAALPASGSAAPVLVAAVAGILGLLGAAGLALGRRRTMLKHR